MSLVTGLGSAVAVSTFLLSPSIEAKSKALSLVAGLGSAEAGLTIFDLLLPFAFCGFLLPISPNIESRDEAIAESVVFNPSTAGCFSLLLPRDEKALLIRSEVKELQLSRLSLPLFSESVFLVSFFASRFALKPALEVLSTRVIFPSTRPREPFGSIVSTATFRNVKSPDQLSSFNVIFIE